MSRKIIQKQEAYQENPANRTEQGKLIITKYQDRELALLLKQNRLMAAHVLDSQSKIGAIYIGKVKNVVKNLDACFVEIADKELCYLPFCEWVSPLMLNRAFDGRILQGDEILVQVQRDAIKTKQATVSCNISSQSEYFVFTLGNTRLGISQKWSKSLRTEAKLYMHEAQLVDEAGTLYCQADLPAYGCVLRTEAAALFNEDKEQFVKAFKEAEEEFVQMLNSAQHKTCFSCLKASKSPYRTILDSFRSTEYQEVLTDLPEAYTSLQKHIENIRLYEDVGFPLKNLYALDTKLQEALSKNVWLKSGGYLVIEQTECLTTIDVNSGKMIQGDKNLEAIRKVNEEAAIEAALQIRLRGLSGIIIVDFINLPDKSEEEKLIKRMKELVSGDIVPTSVIDITALGLMEITRKKVHKSLKEQFAK